MCELRGGKPQIRGGRERRGRVRPKSVPFPLFSAANFCPRQICHLHKFISFESAANEPEQSLSSLSLSLRVWGPKFLRPPAESALRSDRREAEKALPKLPTLVPLPIIALGNVKFIPPHPYPQAHILPNSLSPKRCNKHFQNGRYKIQFSVQSDGNGNRLS